MKKKFASIFLVLTSMGFVFAACGKKDDKDDKNDNKISTSEASTKNKISDRNLEIYATNDSDTAFSLLQKNAEIDYKEYDFGVMVTSINGLESNNEYFWGFYVNDEFSNVGASETKLKEGDKLTWKYEKIES